MLVNEGVEVCLVVIFNVKFINIWFGEGVEWVKKIEDLIGYEVIDLIVKVEFFGLKLFFDCMVIVFLIGNLMSKFVNVMIDSLVLMVVKVIIWNNWLVVFGILINDVFGLNGINLMRFMLIKNIFFILFG